MLRGFVVSIVFMLFAVSGEAAVYYVHPEMGNDTNRGTSKQAAWKSLDKVSNSRFRAGDRVLFAAGTRLSGRLVIEEQEGSVEAPIVFSSYRVGEDTHAHIDGRGELSAVAIINSNHIHLEGLMVSAEGGGIPKEVERERRKMLERGEELEVLMRIGILVETTKVRDFENIHFDNLIIKNVFFHEKGFVRDRAETHTMGGTQEYGFGIRFFVRNGGHLDNVRIANSSIQSVSHTGVKFTVIPKTGGSINDIVIENNRLYRTGGPGIQISRSYNIHAHHNVVNQSGSVHDSRNWRRGSGMWVWGSENVLVEYNQFLNANGTNDSAGFHVDFNCNNVIVQYNLSRNNAGGFIEILGNNYNSAYRYNVSINDGGRNKGENEATHDGKVLWLSGYVGHRKKPHGPYNSYIYNNTIYVREDMLAKFAIVKWAEGIVIANNIFHVVGKARNVVRGQLYNPNKKQKERQRAHSFFENNLFLKKGTWPKQIAIQPKNTIIGDVGFVNAGGKNIRDYIPQNKKLVKNRGVDIPRSKGDPIGLMLGLAVEKDILGNPIIGKPDMGAVEMQ